MRYLFILFAVFAIGILFGAHYIIYKSAIRFFAIENWQFKKYLIIALFILAVSFIVASILTRLDGSVFISGFYFLAGTWYGLLINWLLAAGLGWLIFYTAKIFGLSPNMKNAGLVLCILASLFTLYGIYNARVIRVKTVDAPIKNLPAEWEGKTAVQISDIHVGAINGKKYVEQMITKINKINPDIVFVTGDYFDGTCPHMEQFVSPLSSLNPLLGIYFVTGNHETYEGLDKVIAVLKNSPVKILRDEIVNINGVNIIGVDYPDRSMTKDLAPILNRLDKSQANIMLYHQPTGVEQARNAGVNLQLSGHIHNGQIWPINFITRLIFGKYHNGYINEGGYSINTSSGTATWGPPVRTSGFNEITVLKFRRE